MILTAKNKHAEWDIRVFNLDEVYWELDEAAKRDLKFLEAIKNSIDSRGMLWPPIVWTQKLF